MRLEAAGMIWAGKTLRVRITGKQDAEFDPQAIRDVHAIRDSGGDMQVLVTNDRGKLYWIAWANHEVVKNLEQDLTTGSMTDHQKEGLKTVRQFVTQAITLASAFVGVVGAVLTRTGKPLQRADFLGYSLWAMVASILVGMFVYGAVVAQLSKGVFDAYRSQLRWTSLVQLLLMLLGGVFFVRFILRNV